MGICVLVLVLSGVSEDWVRGIDEDKAEEAFAIVLTTSAEIGLLALS